MQKLVRRNYIHTLGYCARPLLCDWWLKTLMGRSGAASLKTLSNNLDAHLTGYGVPGQNLRVPVIKTPFFIKNGDVSNLSVRFSPKGISISPRPEGRGLFGD